MRKNKLLESLDQRLDKNISVRRYNLADMISESYRLVYNCDEGTNLRSLAESHLADLKENPKDIERLSRQLAVVKEMKNLVESNQLKDEDLVDKKDYDTVEPSEERVIQKCECNESTEVLDPDNARSQIYNAWSYGPGGTPRQLRHTEDSKEIFQRYGINFEDEIDELSDEDAIAMWRELSSLDESNKITESDDPELTDEEVEELAKHLENIRKERKNAPKTDMKEADKPVVPKRRGIKCHFLKDSTEEKLEEEDTANRRVWQLGVDVFCPEDKMSAVKDAVEEAVLSVGPECSVSGIMWGDDSWTAEEYGIKESKNMHESKSYVGLENFKKQSESKAFFKTFKKMHEALKEGKALTRQESIDLYKAANSALTQMSIELEHNPEFLETFKESTDLLSADVNSLRESLSRGKAPSKNTMRSLAKFSESLLYEADDEDEEDEELDGIETNEEDTEEVSDGETSVEDEVPVDDEDTPVEENPEDFVGDDEGSVQSEEADAFDQEYADARVELHKEMEAEHADDEDPAIQDKIEADKAEVLSLDGITDEQVAELSGEESEEAEEPTEDEPTEEEVPDEEPTEDPVEDTDDGEITDDELEELKKHLTEMRAAKKLKESEEATPELLSQVKKSLDDAGIRYQVKGRSGDVLVVSRGDLEKASEIRNKIDPEYTVTVCTPA